jgi:chloride channel 3/4/5
MHLVGELDGGLPIVSHEILVGLIPGPDLEYALDRLEGEDTALCLMNPHEHWQRPYRSSRRHSGDGDGLDGTDHDIDDELQPLVSSPTDPNDLTPYIDAAPVALDICSPMDLVFECFVKLGLRYICVLSEGKFAGMVHKKRFVKYVKEVEKHRR